MFYHSRLVRMPYLCSLCALISAILLFFGFTRSIHAQITVVQFGDSWKYNQPASDPGTSWRTVGYADGSWLSGPGLFGFDDAVIPYPGLRTPVGSWGSPQIVYLFRRTFTYSGTTTGAQFSIDQIADDGVTYYLNGALLGSWNHIPSAWNNTAGVGVGDAAEQINILNGNVTGLINGTNVLSAEVHQVAANGSDMVFGARLRINFPAQKSSEWRQEKFGNNANTGAGADLADGDGDGLPNLVEYALALSPTAPNPTWAQPSVENGKIVVRYSRRKAALNEVTFSCLSATSMSGPWNADGVLEQVAGEDSSTQIVKVEVPLAGATRKFVKLHVQRVSAPAVPLNFAGTTSGATVNLSWTDSPDEFGYTIERRVSGGTFSPLITLPANATSYQDPGLTPGLTYVYRMLATNGTGNSAYTPDVRITLSEPVPSPASNLVATAASTSQINLSWADNSSNETAFRIERRQSGTPTFTLLTEVGANVTSYQDQGLPSGIRYYYQVAAKNGSGTSAFTTTAYATTLTTPPATPSDLVATAVSTSQINLAWADNSSNETGFRIERRQSGTPTFTLLAEVGANTTSYQDQALPADTRFYYQVSARNDAGNSAFTPVAYATTLNTPPSAPSDLVATAVSTSQINLSWADNSSNETAFRIERRQSGTPTFTLLTEVGANSTAYQDQGLLSGVRYYYQIAAKNGVGNSAFTSIANATTTATIPTAPSNLVATAVSTSQINLLWADNSGNENGFKIERRRNDEPAFTWLADVGAGVTSFQNTGLPSGTRFYYRVNANNAAGNSNYSAEAMAETAINNLNGPGVGNLTYNAGEFMQVISRFDTHNGVPELGGHGYGLNVATMHKGYLAMVFAPDSGWGNGGLLFYDISNPRNPVLVNRVHEPGGRTTDFREAHSMGFCSSLGGDHVVLQTGKGVEFWDWTDVRNPQQLSKLALPGMNSGDYTQVVWWLFWQAPYVYAGAAEQGLFIIDASDPRNPRIVDRGGGRPNPIPTSQLGGFPVGPVFAIGNSLILTGFETDNGFSMLDISNPKNPQLISSMNKTNYGFYSTNFSGNRIYAGGRGANRDKAPLPDGQHLMVYDTSNPESITLVNQSIGINEDQLYVQTQDQYLFVGCQFRIQKVDTTNFTVVGEGNLGVNDADHGQVTPIGNLVFVGNDHGTGSALFCHQTSPDHRAPEVNMVSPKNQASNQALTSRVGLTLTDNIDLRTVTNTTFIVRPAGGAALTGKYSAQNGHLNFWPDQPLNPGTTYEVIIPAGGMKDWMGNGVNGFNSTFSTAP